MFNVMRMELLFILGSDKLIFFSYPNIGIQFSFILDVRRLLKTIIFYFRFLPAYQTTNSKRKVVVMNNSFLLADSGLDVISTSYIFFKIFF